MNNANKIYFISGVSGVGKTSTILHLKKMLPADKYDIRDFDERGVPDGGGPIWHDNETRYWLSVAASNAEQGKSTIVSGFTNPDQFKKVHNPEKVIPAQLILLNASADTIRERLYSRHLTLESKLEIKRAAGVTLNVFIENCASFAPELRLIFERNGFPIIDTDNKTPEEVAREVVSMIL